MDKWDVINQVRTRWARPLYFLYYISKNKEQNNMSMSEQAKAGFIEVSGTRLYYEEMGEGHPLVLIHGGYMDRRMWDDQFAIFAEQYRVIRYDVRGFGKSALPTVPYADRQDLYELLTAL